jgi:hypothetical protein
MAITAQHIRDTLTAYLDQRPEDKDSVSALQAEEVLDYSWQYAGTITAEPLHTRLLAVATV